MNDTVVSENIIKRLISIAETPVQLPSRASEHELQIIRISLLAGGVALAQTLCNMLGVVFTDNLDEKELDNLKEQDNV